ncbi:MAG: AAA family ATPase [Nitrospirae bacterium]|nr:AAA family ATPase [Nitrospirota bacterium]
MITSLHIKNFKSHEDTLLNLSNINVLTGLNGMGKSSVLQAMLLLRQSNIKGNLTMGLDLNGDLYSIGTAKDAIYMLATTDKIELSLTQENKNDDIHFEFEVNTNKLSDTFLKHVKNTNELINPYCSLFNNNFQYISAFRNGPVSSYEKKLIL